MTQHVVHVAVGVIFNTQKQVLVALRPAHLSQGGLWEFPGGKVEMQETVLEALARELNEEVGIQVLAAKELIKLEHQYSDKKVLLDVWEVTDFSGVPYGREGQIVRWVEMMDLLTLNVPEANAGIVKTILEVHAHYQISAE